MIKKQLNEKITEVKKIQNDENNITDIAGLLQITENDKLAQAVFKQLGGENNVTDMLEVIDTLKDIAKHGIQDGYNGFIYTADSCEFFDKNKVEILNLIANDAQDFDINELEMINNFPAIKNSGEPITLQFFYEAMKNKGTGNEDNSYEYIDLKNSLSLYVANRVASNYTDLIDDKENIDKTFIAKAETKLKNYTTKKIQKLKNEFAKSNTNEISM